MGDRFVIWGGAVRNMNKFFDDGATLKDGAWTRLPPSPLAGRYGVAAVRFEDKFILWGGLGGGVGNDLYTDGAIFDGRGWTLLPKTEVAGRCHSAAGVFGSKLIVWGGYDSNWKPAPPGGEISLPSK